MLSQAVQDYLKTIYKLEEEENGPVATTHIAKVLDISGASVTGMLKRLSKMQLVDYNSYKGVKLTQDGRKIALEILRHHRLLEVYLKESLGFSLAKVHDEACRLEHYVSDEFVERIDKILGNPEYSPFGNPIPSKEGDIPLSPIQCLNDADIDEDVKIKKVDDTDNEKLEYLETIGLLPGVSVKILDKAPFNGPLTLSYNGNKKIIGNEIASCIFVDKM